MSAQGRIHGKVALITGSTAGIGKATAFRFVNEGAYVVVSGRREELGKEIVAELNKIRPKSAVFVKLDVTLEDDWKNAIQQTLQSFGKLDILINNSGIAGSAPVDTSDLQMLQKVFATNVEGVYLGTRYGAEALKKNPNGGSIINISSVVSTVVFPGVSLYSASKAAVEHFSRIAALEYAPYKIRVNTVAPGITDTDMYDSVIIGPMIAAKMATAKEEIVKLQAAKIPLKKIPGPEEVAHPILFLASDEASFITGISIQTDGGSHLQYQGL